MEGVSSIASPLTRLTQKMVKFQWSDNCEKSFAELKTMGSVANVEEERKELGKDVHMLALLRVRLMSLSIVV